MVTGYIFKESKQYNLLMSYEWLSSSVPLHVPISGFRFHCAALSRLSDCMYQHCWKILLFPLDEYFGQKPKDGKSTAYL